MATNSSDVTAGVNATATQYNNIRKDIVTGRRILVTATDGATVTFNLDSGNIQQVTLGGNRTLALSNDNDHQVFIIILIQGGTGSRTVTWWSGIKWQDEVEPTLDTAAAGVDVFGFIRTGSGAYLGFPMGQRMA